MKTRYRFFQTGAIGLLLVFAVGMLPASLRAQTAPNPTLPITQAADLDIGRLNDDETTVESMPTAVFFYNPATNGPSMTLTASRTDLVTGLDFDSYAWHQITNNGVEDVETLLSAETTHELELENLSPGYHRYRVYGLIHQDALTCESDQYQDIILFVLRPLALDSPTPTDAITEFCLNDVPTDTVPLEVDVSFDAAAAYNTHGFANPDAEDFQLTYRWYAKNSESADPEAVIELNGGGENGVGATNTMNLDLSLLTEKGTYTFFVDVQYSATIKDRGTRTYATWTETVGGAATPYQITVTPVPGRPTITIENVVD